MGRTNRQRSAETQRRLLDATIDCIVELGYPNATTTAICERAGVSRGAQLHHYPTKAELVAAAIEHLVSARHAEFREGLGEHPDLDGAFDALWEIYSGETLYAWLELVIASRTDPSLRVQMREVDDRFFAEAKLTCCQLLGLAEDDARAAAFARLIMSVFDGLCLNYTLGGREEVTAQVLTVLEGALGAMASGM